MRNRHRLSDRDIDRILAGQAPAGGDEADARLAHFAATLRTTLSGAPASEVEQAHVAAAVAASQSRIEKGDPVVRPASKANGPRREASGLPTWRRRTMLSSLFASLTAKIALGAVAAVAATGSLAAAGALPGPAQNVVSSAASTVGINLPTAHDHSDVTETDHPDATETDSSDQSDATTTVVPTSTATPTSTSTPTATATPMPNHGQCVSYAAHTAVSLGFSGSEKGLFVSTVAQDSTAVSLPVPDGGMPDAACQAAITKAEAAVAAAGSGHGKGGPPTSTVTPANGGDHGNSSNAGSNSSSGASKAHAKS